MPRLGGRPISALIVALVLLLALPEAASAAQSPADRVITANGVGHAVLGSTPEELADQLGPDYDVGDEMPITVDFDGHVVSSAGEVQFRAVATADTEQLHLFIVSNPGYVTAEGVGPTITIADAETVYGDATLSWNPDNESREFVSFANGPAGRIAFRTPGIGGTNVGIYEEGEFETTDYLDGAVIATVWVSCLPGTDCPADRATDTPPEPTPTPQVSPVPTPGPDVTPMPNDEAGSGTVDGELPRTGATELALSSIAAVFFMAGAALLVLERRSAHSG